MQRVSFVLNIRPEDHEEYIRRHEAVYPELLQAFGEVGIRTYSIFLHGGTLFAYMEVEDYEQAQVQLANHEANQRWQTYMSDLLIVNAEGSTSQVIPEVFHYHS
ncbi:L-rhamnose mutarotase [Paenibacillus shenyangensis]|uniref:L-rhamnose mutarotase n=1 Tax=Paenibacillus sp. A9 TaxID=1284352 RepID=UPI00035D1707|nr:L-rhamnose mutarotase [Paenibacillus sp. A9]